MEVVLRLGWPIFRFAAEGDRTSSWVPPVLCPSGLTESCGVVMRAIILAAGLGSRLGGDVPKCLVEVGGRPLLHHQIENLRAVGVTDVTVVVGYGHDRVRLAGRGGLDWVMNERFATTNSLYSFWLARRASADDVLLLNGDVLFPLQVLARLLSVPASAVAFDSGSGTEPEHMKVALHQGRLTSMSKSLPPACTHGENLGILRLTAAAAASAFAAADALISGGADADWVASAVNVAASAHRIRGVDMAGLPWIEIDFPADLLAARSSVWPRIEALAAARGSAQPAASLAARDLLGDVRVPV